MFYIQNFKQISSMHSVYIKVFLHIAFVYFTLAGDEIHSVETTPHILLLFKKTYNVYLLKQNLVQKTSTITPMHHTRTVSGKKNNKQTCKQTKQNSEISSPRNSHRIVFSFSLIFKIQLAGAHYVYVSISISADSHVFIL